MKIVGSIIELSHMRDLKTSEKVGFELLLFAYVRIAFASFLKGKEVFSKKVKTSGVFVSEFSFFSNPTFSEVWRPLIWESSLIDPVIPVDFHRFKKLLFSLVLLVSFCIFRNERVEF